MLRRITLFAAVLGLTAGLLFEAAPPTSADVLNPGGTEEFVMAGFWSCTNGSCTTVASSGAATCSETEAEFVGLTPDDVAVDVGCGVSYTGTLARTCGAGACAYVGALFLAIQDGSDPGYTIHLTVDVYGTSASTGSWYVPPSLVVADVREYSLTNPTIAWTGEGGLSGNCVDVSGNCFATWAMTLQGVQL